MDKRGFTSYLEAKNLAPKTIFCNTENVKLFLRWAKTCAEKEEIQITKPDILKYLEYLKNGRKQQNVTRKLNLAALNHYFNFLYQTEQITQNPCLFLKIRGTKKKTLYNTYTPEELEQLFDNYYQLFVRNYVYSHIPKNRQEQSALSRERNALILSILIYQGIRAGEMEKIETDDLDLRKATIKIRGVKRGKDRVLPLKAAQTGLLMHYLQNIRPQFLEYHATDSDKLFLALPAINKKGKNKNSLRGVFNTITEQLKTIDKQFLNVLQIRASVITFWLKTEGLRKTQYMAGHRYVSSTEEYLPNNLDGLIDDINKMHPF